MAQLFICPKAHFKFTPVEGIDPPRWTCPKCGRGFLFQCSRCGERFRGDDAETSYHDCGERIPWAKDYAREAKKHGPVTWDYWEQMAHAQEGWTEPPNETLGPVKRVLGQAFESVMAKVLVALVVLGLAAYCGINLPQ